MKTETVKSKPNTLVQRSQVAAEYVLLILINLLIKIPYAKNGKLDTLNGALLRSISKGSLIFLYPGSKVDENVSSRAPQKERD